MLGLSDECPIVICISALQPERVRVRTSRPTEKNFTIEISPRIIICNLGDEIILKLILLFIRTLVLKGEYFIHIAKLSIVPSHKNGTLQQFYRTSNFNIHLIDSVA